MKDSVRAAFVAFTTPIEGVVPYMYLDVKGLVTTAIGNLIDPCQVALNLPFVHKDGTFAARNEIAAEWLRVKHDPDAARLGHTHCAGITDLRLTAEGVNLVVSRKLQQMGEYLASRFPDFEEWPADGQLATLSMSWACGPAFHFPALDQYLRELDFDGAATSCKINEAGNHGVAPRNLANRRLYSNAARVQAMHLDPDKLFWPLALEEGPETQPEVENPPSDPIPLVNTDIMDTVADNSASSPTCYPLPPDPKDAA